MLRPESAIFQDEIFLKSKSKHSFMTTGGQANSIAPLNQPTRFINKLFPFYYVTLAIRIAIKIAQTPLQNLKKMIGFQKHARNIYISGCVSFQIRELSYHINNTYPSLYLSNCNIRHNEYRDVR